MVTTKCITCATNTATIRHIFTAEWSIILSKIIMCHQWSKRCYCSSGSYTLTTIGEYRQMIEFTASVRTWLEADPNNVIAVHCKGMVTILLQVGHERYRNKLRQGEKGVQAPWYAFGSSRLEYFTVQRTPWSTSGLGGRILHVTKLFKVLRHQAK